MCLPKLGMVVCGWGGGAEAVSVPGGKAEDLNPVKQLGASPPHFFLGALALKLG